MSEQGRRPPRSWTAVVAILALAALALASCGQDGDGDGDPAEVRAAVQELRRAYAARDWDRVCARLTASAKRQMGLMAHGEPDRCQADLRGAHEVLRDGGGFAGDGLALGEVEIDGDRAEATVRRGARSATVPLLREAGRWRVDSFFGSRVAAATRFVEDSRSDPFPARSGPAVEPLDAAGKRCLGYLDDAYPQIDGDCSLSLRSRPLPLTVMTPMGLFRFANCRITANSWIAPDGRTWTDDFQASAIANNGCSDVQQCKFGDFQGPVPWKGRLRSEGDGVLVHRMEACFWTCLGYFVGDLEIRLTRDGRSWRVEAVEADVGASGLRFDGPLALGDQFDVRLRERAG